MRVFVWQIIYMWTVEEVNSEWRLRSLRSHVWVGLLAVGLVFALPLLVGVSTVYGGPLVWQGSVDSSGVEVTGPVLASGTPYVIVAKNTWWYKYLPDNLAADAMYYTTDPSNNIYWGNHFPELSGHSFLQVDKQDVDWGPFSNGDAGHTYSLVRDGAGAAVSFRIVDWMDDNYTNNVCHIIVSVYVNFPVGGEIVDTSGQVRARLLTYFAVTGLMFACATALASSKKIRG